MWDFLSKAGGSIMDGVSNVGSAVGEGLSTMGEYAGAGLSHIAERLQDEDFQHQARVFGAVMSDDQNRYQAALNAYDQRKAEIAKQKREDMQRAEARQQKLADLKEQRQYSEQNEWLKSYTPESVAQFRQTGDKSVLVSDTVTEMVYDNGIQYQIVKDKATGQEVSRTRATAYDKPTSDTGDWYISGNYKYNRKTGEVVALDGNGDGNGDPTMRTTSGGKPIPVGYDEEGNLYYQSTNPNYVTDANGMPVLAADIGKLDPMDPTKRQALQKKVDDEESAYQAPAKASADMSATAQKLLDHEGFDRAYGNVDSKLPTIRQSTADAEVLREQLQGQVFLSQRHQLKGQGQITDYESQRAEAALTIATNPRSSQEAARAALKELQELDAKIQDRVKRGVDVDGNPVRHRRARDPLAQPKPNTNKPVNWSDLK